MAMDVSVVRAIHRRRPARSPLSSADAGPASPSLRLEVGHAVVVTKNPHQVREAEMFKASVQPTPTITPDGEKTEIALRFQAAMQSQAIAVKTALGGRQRFAQS
jgi:hypothetical protein